MNCLLRVCLTIVFLQPSNTLELFAGNQANQQLVDVVGEITWNAKKQESIAVNVFAEFGGDLNHRDVVEEVLKRNSGEFCVRLGNYMRTGFVKKRFNVVFINDIASFRSFNKKLVPKVFLFRGIFIFVLVDGKIEEIREIFETLWAKNIFNVNVIFYDAKTIKVVTFFPFSEKCCNDTKPIVIRSYRNGSFTEKGSIFPDKFKNLHSCPLRVTIFEGEFSVIKTKLTDGSFKLSGYDIDLIRELSKSLNFKPEFKMIEERQPFGRVFLNGTANGALADLVDRSCDITLGEYLTDLKGSIADSSVVYNTFPFVFVIPPGRKLSHIRKLLLPFKSFVWVSIIAVFAAASVVTYLLNFKLKAYRHFVYGSGINQPFMNIAAAVLGIAQPKLPKANFSRFLLMQFLMFCLVVRSAYQGSLFKFLQSNGRENEAKTVNELLQQNFEIFFSSEHFESFLELSSNGSARLKVHDIYSPERFYNDSTNQVAFIDTLANVIQENTRRNGNVSFRILRQSLWQANVAFYYPKDFYLVQKLDQKISSLFSSGIVRYLIDKYFDSRYMTVGAAGVKEIERISLDHVTGAFILWFVLLTFSTVVFCVEKLRYVYKTFIRI